MRQNSTIKHGNTPTPIWHIKKDYDFLPNSISSQWWRWPYGRDHHQKKSTFKIALRKRKHRLNTQEGKTVRVRRNISPDGFLQRWVMWWKARRRWAKNIEAKGATSGVYSCDANHIARSAKNRNNRETIIWRKWVTEISCLKSFVCLSSGAKRSPGRKQKWHRVLRGYFPRDFFSSR